jgi:hypothetical protein
MAGKWLVDYSTAPPPSNGKLGPFEGDARQIINLDSKSYVNLLTVGPNAWLSAELTAKWKEWDGVIISGEKEDKSHSEYYREIESDEVKDNLVNVFDSLARLFPSKMSAISANSVANVDHGASSWRVTFENLQIRVFGFPILNKEFENTSRIWKMTYVDETTRIVRAGRTGRSEDDAVFFMSRDV